MNKIHIKKYVQYIILCKIDKNAVGEMWFLKNKNLKIRGYYHEK